MPVNQELSKAISERLGGDLSEEQVARVLASVEAVEEGADLGTVVRQEGGEVAVRVEFRGVPRWLVCSPTGSTHFDMQPTLAGETLYPKKVVRRKRSDEEG